MPDATGMYEHYWGNSGTSKERDYDKAYREASGIRAGVDSEVARAARAAEEIIRAGRMEFSMTGAASVAETYPKTENWQKADGGYQVCRFTEVGWAKPFDTHGSMTRTITWELGNPPTGLTGGPAPDDGVVRGGERDRGPTPDNPREPGRNRAR